MNKNTLKFLVMMALLGNCEAGVIKVLAWDGDTRLSIGEMTSEQYEETITGIKSALDIQIINSMANFQDRDRSWHLSKLSLGLGVSGEIGIGPFKFGKALKQRFIYSR